MNVLVLYPHHDEEELKIYYYKSKKAVQINEQPFFIFQNSISGRFLTKKLIEFLINHRYKYEC